MRVFNVKKANIVLSTIVIVLLLLYILLAESGRFSKEPEITIAPDNCYSETLTVITDTDYKPYSFFDSKGNQSGHDVELMILIANKMHKNLKLTLLPWNQAIKETLAGNADILMTCDYSDSFAGIDQLIKSEPISTDDFIVYSKSNINSLDELYGKRIAIMKNGNVTTDINRMHLEKYCVEYPDNRLAMQALIDNEVDFAIMRQTVGTVLLKELKNTSIEGYISIGQSNMCFGIKGNPELVDEVNNILEELRMNGEIERLRKKWLTTFIRPYSFTEILSNNIWIAFSFIFLIVVIIFTVITTEYQKRIAAEEKFRNTKIVEWLTLDFECLNYIEITDNPLNDQVINYRISEKLKELIPGWEKEKYFSNKLDLLRNILVYEPDRQQWDTDTKRIRVINDLTETGVYFVNTRFFFDNELHYYQLKFSPVYENNKIKGMVAGLHSVDAQTKKEMALQEQLQEALAQAKVASNAKSDFLFNMSHDIRTPLNAISGFTNMAIKYIDDKDKALDCLHKTQQSGTLLLSLINSVLDMSRIESGKASLDEQYGDIFYSFINIEGTMKELANAKNITLTFDFGEIRDKYVLCDFLRCNRIFVNIISNAIKYSNENGFVHVHCEQIENTTAGYGNYKYTFEDNGIGMSEEFQKHVFEKFSRESNVTHSGIQGTGLGLSVCKSFVELMNGSIECNSIVGKGTTFTVILPFKLQRGNFYTDEATGTVIELKDIPKNEHSFNKLSFRGKRILLAEDNELNQEIAVDILHEASFIVETVKDGTEAVQILKDKGPDYFDYILMDIQMPIMGGYEATQEIRKLYPEKRIPIIALSANAFADDKAASLEAGMDNHVAKPIDIEELFKALSQF